MNLAPPLPRIRVVSPSQSCAHAAIAREVADRLNRDQLRRDDAGAAAYRRFLANVMARIGLKP